MSDVSGRCVVLNLDAERVIRLTGLKRRRAVRISERRLLEGAWIEAWSVELSIGVLVHDLEFTREDFLEALQQDAARYGFRIRKRDWGRAPQ